LSLVVCIWVCPYRLRLFLKTKNTYTTKIDKTTTREEQDRKKNKFKISGVVGKARKRPKKRGRKSHFSGLWVGAFSVLAHGVYRNPVHILAIFGLKYAKSVVLGVDVIQGLARILQPLKRVSSPAALSSPAVRLVCS